MTRSPEQPRIRHLPVVVVALALAVGFALPGSADARSVATRTLAGVVEGDGGPQAGYEVSLYASRATEHPSVAVLGTDTTEGSGRFHIEYRVPPGLSQQEKLVLYVLAEKGQAMLASAIGDGSQSDRIVVNELTTVAIGTAFAQFIDGRTVSGNAVGMSNAVGMAANMVDPRTGAVGEVLDNSPNADETSTRATFYSLANIVASCVADDAACDRLFLDATATGGPIPRTVLQALANMTRYPSNPVIRASDLFRLSFANPIYGPALGRDEEPTSWLLFIKFTGGFYSAYAADNLMSGPGNVAFDQRGFAWINDNYVPTETTVPPDPKDEAQIGCAGLRVMKFFPWGESFPGSPYFGGGLSGAGFGITVDRHSRIWVGNYGFEAPACSDGTIPPDPSKKIPATHDSVSAFLPDGTPISGSDGFTQGHIWWPQGTVSDKKGNVWIANCGNDTVTLIPSGKPDQARNIALPGGQGAMGNFQLPLVDDPTAAARPLIKPFGAAIDPKGRLWITGNAVGFDQDYQKTDPVGGVYRISRDGTVETMASPSDELLSWPMGIYGDSKGNMWVSSSDSVNVPCVTPLDPEGGEIGPAVVYFPADGGSPRKFVGGGLTIPWGNVVDGADTIWVFNFGQHPIDAVTGDTSWPDTPVSRFCGADTSSCPADLSTGDAISPDSGYVSDALDRITGGAVDPSGNLWLLNNWKKEGPYGPVFNTNPGGNSFVIVPGAAAPVRTPVIGPPQSFGPRSN
jgi:sugar lactone lactonase YvrE